MPRRPKVVGAGGVEEAENISIALWDSDTAFIRAMHRLDDQKAKQEAEWASLRERWRVDPCPPEAWLGPQENAPAAPVPTDSKDDTHKRLLATVVAKLEANPADKMAQAELNAMMKAKP